MRVTLADATLARQAGRFVWLEIDWDKRENQAFFASHKVAWTPAFFVLDPADERATATHFGGMTRAELDRFLDRGERGVRARARAPADAALARGAELAGRGSLAAAADAYREALRRAGPGWPRHDHAVDALTAALAAARDWRACAETAAGQAPRMRRDRPFASVLHSGLACASSGAPAPWAEGARIVLEPLAESALAVPAALRDDRFQLYQQLMVAAAIRDDHRALVRWGDRWLAEIDATAPGSDDERNALDIARVDAVSLLDDPARALPALAASERAMPGSYGASARLARVLMEAGRIDDALAACKRGLARAPGPIGRTGLLLTRAQALMGKGQTAAARRALREALRSARAIGDAKVRAHHIERVAALVAKAGAGQDARPAPRRSSPQAPSRSPALRVRPPSTAPSGRDRGRRPAARGRQR